MKQIALALASLVAVAAPLAAQHAQHFPPSPPAAQPPASIPLPRAPNPIGAQDAARAGMDPLGMMDTMELLLPPALRFAPGRLLEREHELMLTRDQADRLTQIGQRAEAARAAVIPGYADHVRQLRETLAARDPDPAVADGHLAAVQEAMGAVHRAELRAALEARAVLTADQRRRVEGLVPSGPPHE